MRRKKETPSLHPLVFMPLPPLHVEYAERRRTYGILFIYRPFYEYSNLEYVHVPV